MKPAAKDVAHAFLRAVSPFVATCPGTPASTQTPEQGPQPVLLGGNTAKVCQKTRESDAFMPTANPPASKKVFENKDTIA